MNNQQPDTKPKPAYETVVHKFDSGTSITATIVRVGNIDNDIRRAYTPDDTKGHNTKQH